MFRIKKYPKGFVVEVKRYRWTLFGLKEAWRPYILTNVADCAWHHSSYEMALMNFKNQTYWELVKNTDYKTIHNV